MKDNKIRIVPIAIPLVLSVIVLIAAITNPNFADIMTNLFIALMSSGGWIVALAIVLFMAFLFFMIFSSYGNIKFGGPDAKPKYDLWNWFAISLCAGIGTGIVFWGPTEPLMIAWAPPATTGLEAGSYEAIIYAMVKSFQHWTLQPYSIYCAAGIVCGYAYYNMKKNYTSSSGLVFYNKGKTLPHWATELIDTFVLFAIVGGTAGSLGWGLLQIGKGVEFVSGITSGPMVWIVIAVVIVISYTISSATGLDKGIKFLSDQNLKAYIILLVITFIFCSAGSKSYITNLTTEATGNYLNNLVSITTFTQPTAITAQATNDLWPQWWDLYWMVDWLSFGPITGLILIKMAYGRTVREFLVVNFILPAVFGIIWFGIFGGYAIHIQLSGAFDLVNYLNVNGAEAFMMKFFDFLPLSTVLRVFMLIIIAVSFITLADSTTSTIAQMSLKKSVGVKEAPLPIKVFWGVIIGTVSLVFVITGGISGIKIVKTIAGYPMVFIESAMVIGFLYHLLSGKYKGDEKEYSEFLAEQAKIENVESLEARKAAKAKTKSEGK